MCCFKDRGCGDVTDGAASSVPRHHREGKTCLVWSCPPALPASFLIIEHEFELGMDPRRRRWGKDFIIDEGDEHGTGVAIDLLDDCSSDRSGGRRLAGKNHEDRYRQFVSPDGRLDFCRVSPRPFRLRQHVLYAINTTLIRICRPQVQE